MDIGGGSTEIASTKKSYSLSMGSVSLTEKFLREKALSQERSLDSLAQHIQSSLKKIQPFLNENYDALIFVAGTPVTLAFMEKKTSDSNKIHGLLLKEEQVSFWLEKLAALSVEERKKVALSA